MPIHTATRDEARDLYLQIFDEFASDANPAQAHIVALINDAFSTHEMEQGIVEDAASERGVYDSDRIWQCWQTYDHIDRTEAERLFDQAWPESHSIRTLKAKAPAKSSGGKTDPRRAVTDSWKCYCGCGKDRRTKRTLFAPGHDARFASNLVKAVKAGAMSADAARTEADEVSPAMGRKVKAALERLAASKSGAAGPAESNGGVTKGYVTVNRVRIPAERFEIDGGIRLNINDSADGSGDWLDAEDYDSKTQAYWLKRFHAEAGS